MRQYCSLIAVLGLLLCVRSSYGLATEQFGPNSAQPGAAHVQPGSFTGIAGLRHHESRVYSIYINGNEGICFNASPDEIVEMIEMFAKAPLRDHELTLIEDVRQVKSIGGDKFEYNLHLNLIGRFLPPPVREGEDPRTFDPTMTLFGEELQRRNRSRQSQPRRIFSGAVFRRRDRRSEDRQIQAHNYGRQLDDRGEKRPSESRGRISRT